MRAEPTSSDARGKQVTKRRHAVDNASHSIAPLQAAYWNDVERMRGLGHSMVSLLVVGDSRLLGNSRSNACRLTRAAASCGCTLCVGALTSHNLLMIQVLVVGSGYRMA